ncbi:k(+)-insensitive pyrophosphate-energized proton pump [Anaeramoeba flamelloides]|uniref:H(+)-exporting diphosphatase n=1 Tax=Anaeramoeba flamelloides TaxID=1746091 RepID=A0AAV8A0V5_9EUKA|nr:k(+)-insensitive pyrophosphate-energized proton pump [Anaeramoeba flamelloides]|eukprot:Anaeramoba_flamelloidesa86622_249.p1 GENE.a86622_249~~a86622_249.p1  ORF type:complete len:767 (-),score=172.21 a86622_249:191-2491(-)
MTFGMQKVDTIWFPIAGSLLGFFSVAVLIRAVLKSPKASKEVEEIGELIRKGAKAFLWMETKILVFVVAVLGIMVAVLTWENNGYRELIAYLFGVLCSAAAGIIGMYIGTQANTRTVQGAYSGVSTALRIALNGGAVMSFSVVSLSLLGVTICWIAFDAVTCAAFGFGASTIALFFRAAGGIFTKSSDVGADLVGKVEQNLPEDDPRNAGAIADNVGDQVGDIAGLGSDLFESFVGSLVAGVILALSTYNEDTENPTDYRGVAFTLFVGFVGIIAAIFGALSVRTRKDVEVKQTVLLNALRRGVAITAILILVGTLIGGVLIFSDDKKEGYKLFGCVAIGLIVGLLIGFWTEYYTSYDYSPTLKVSRMGLYGAAPVVIQGTSLGLISTSFPVIGIVVAILTTYTLKGVFGTAIAALGLLSTLGFTLATDAYGPIADNAGGISEMSNQPKKIRDLTDQLDALGNTNAALGKAFCVTSATITSLALIEAYREYSGIEHLNVLNPVSLAGLLVGGLLPCLFSSLTMSAVCRGASEVINEVRRQFNEIPGLLEGTAKCDPEICVSKCTKRALIDMIVPGILILFSPLAVGFLLGNEALGSMLIGTVVVGNCLAIYFANSGGSWDNAKKACECGMLGEDHAKGSETHKALVVGDTVGDPFKDVSGPSIDVLCKLMANLSLMLGKRFTKGYDQWVIGLIIVILEALLIGIYYLVINKFDKSKMIGDESGDDLSIDNSGTDSGDKDTLLENQENIDLDENEKSSVSEIEMDSD